MSQGAAATGLEQGASAPRLELSRISKTFGRRTVLSDVSLSVAPGEMHGIVGQNGSGKSTLAKSISGYHPPDAGGEIRVDGHPLRLPVRPQELLERGVSIVHQSLGLVEEASVVENVRIAVMRGAAWSRRIAWSAERAKADETLRRLGYTGSMRTPVGELAPADRARVAIGRAIQAHRPGEGLIIFDESTRALPADALDDFYRTVHALQAEGTGVLMIGHRLGEILEHCDRVTVLRDGCPSAVCVPTHGLTEGALAEKMLGHELRHLHFERGERSPDAQVVSVRGLRGPGLGHALDLELGRGEILGITGLPGSGFEAVPYLLGGARAGEGTLAFGDEHLDVASSTISALIRRGVVLVPEDRPQFGLALEQTITDNIALPWLGERGRPWSSGRRWQRDAARQVIDRLGVVPPDPRHLVAGLSGGNAQKVLLGKWLLARPALLLLHEPTQGVDVKARQDLLGAVHEAAADGTTVILASTEPEDLVTVCDRVLVFRAGRIDRELRLPFEARGIVDTIYPRTVQARPMASAAVNPS